MKAGVPFGAKAWFPLASHLSKDVVIIFEVSMHLKNSVYHDYSSIRHHRGHPWQYVLLNDILSGVDNFTWDEAMLGIGPSYTVSLPTTCPCRYLSPFVPRLDNGRCATGGY